MGVERQTRKLRVTEKGDKIQPFPTGRGTAEKRPERQEFAKIKNVAFSIYHFTLLFRWPNFEALTRQMSVALPQRTSAE